MWRFNTSSSCYTPESPELSQFTLFSNADIRCSWVRISNTNKTPFANTYLSFWNYCLFSTAIIVLTLFSKLSSMQGRFYTSWSRFSVLLKLTTVYFLLFLLCMLYFALISWMPINTQWITDCNYCASMFYLAGIIHTYCTAVHLSFPFKRQCII